MPGADDSDRSLVARLAATRDAAALAEVVRRWGGLVHGVCRRRSGAAAGPATVAVFRALLAEAPRVECLPLWLHARAGAIAPADGGETGDDPVWAALAPRLDDALASLPAEPRQWLLLAHGMLPPRAQGAAWAAEFAGPLAAPLAAAHAALAHALADGGPAIEPQPLAGLLERELIEPPPPAVARELAGLALASLAAPETAPPRRTLPKPIAIMLLGAIVIAAIAIAVQMLAPHAKPAAPPAPAAPPR